MSAHRQQLLIAAEQAVGQGRLDQAVRLLSGELTNDLPGRRLAIDLHEQLVQRCREAIRRIDWRTAVDQLRLLRELEGESNQLDRLVHELRSSAEQQSRQFAIDGRFDEIESLCSILSSAGIHFGSMEQFQSAIQSIRSARKLAALGRFAEAETQLRQGHLGVQEPWIENEIKWLQKGHEQTKTLLAKLHQATESNRWDEASKLADELLQVASRHPLALQMRQRAALELAAQGKKEVLPPNTPKRTPLMQVKEPRNDMAIAMHKHPSTHAREPRQINDGEPSIARVAPTILWIDGVGGYVLCDQLEVVIGQAIPGNNVDLMIVGDLSRRAAAIRKSGEDHLLQPLQAISVNDVAIDRATILRDGDLLTLGQRVQLQYMRPNRLSSTARLQMLSRHRWQPSVDGVLLMGDSCVLGPGSTSHILCPFWSSDVLLFRNRDQWMCRSSQPLEVEGKEYRDAVPLVRGKRIRGSDFSMTLE